MVNIEIKNRKIYQIKLKPGERLVRYLIENKEPVSIKRVSEETKIDYKNTHNLVKELLSRNIIVKENIGNMNPIRINVVPNSEIYSVEKRRTQNFLEKNVKFKLIVEDIKEIRYPFMIVLIFGSFVKENENSLSDVDICIISDNEDKTKALVDKLKLLSLNMDIHDFTTKEFTSMIEKKENNLGNEIMKRNIILYGIENYYNLISKEQIIVR